MKTHQYEIDIQWTGNLGVGTTSYKSYERSYSISGKGKNIVIEASSDVAFLGDGQKYNPEELFLSSISSCHMLWYLHLCADEHITVEEYHDSPQGMMIEKEDGKGHFTKAILEPHVVIHEAEKVELAKKLHQTAHEYCFIVNSCNFPIVCQPTVTVIE